MRQFDEGVGVGWTSARVHDGAYDNPGFVSALCFGLVAGWFYRRDFGLRSVLID